MSHTPGPWTLDKHGTLKGSNGKSVGFANAGVYFSCSEHTEEEKANTRIIHCAPDGLALAEMVHKMEAKEGGMQKASVRLRAIYTAARAIVEKAGKQ